MMMTYFMYAPRRVKDGDVRSRCPCATPSCLQEHMELHNRRAAEEREAISRIHAPTCGASTIVLINAHLGIARRGNIWPNSNIKSAADIPRPIFVVTFDLYMESEARRARVVRTYARMARDL